jgi:hypothetical protein
MNDDKPRTTLHALAAVLGGEGFGEHAANEVKRYWNRRVMSDRQAGRVERIRSAFSQMVADKLDDRDRVVLGKFLGLLCKCHFDTGLRLGLMTLAAEFGREKEPEAPAPPRPPKGEAKQVAARGQKEPAQSRAPAGATPEGLSQP